MAEQVPTQKLLKLGDVVFLKDRRFLPSPLYVIERPGIPDGIGFAKLLDVQGRTHQFDLRLLRSATEEELLKVDWIDGGEIDRPIQAIADETYLHAAINSHGRLVMRTKEGQTIRNIFGIRLQQGLNPEIDEARQIFPVTELEKQIAIVGVRLPKATS